ncbi:glutamate ligase domain-containing protein [Streptomyces sp. MS19]|uniref:glutamate ligase domain-containing protein n=1 Tax=Streptomyces sp. MS19 TaxID=3385972 RepID=UPI00399FA526
MINDAFNANPDSVRAALDALTALSGGRRTLAVLGEMNELGPGAAVEHRRVGALAAPGIRVLVTVGTIAI